MKELRCIGTKLGICPSNNGGTLIGYYEMKEGIISIKCNKCKTVNFVEIKNSQIIRHIAK